MQRDSDRIYTMPLLAGLLMAKDQCIPYPEVEGVLLFDKSRQLL